MTEDQYKIKSVQTNLNLRAKEDGIILLQIFDIEQI